MDHLLDPGGLSSSQEKFIKNTDNSTCYNKLKRILDEKRLMDISFIGLHYTGQNTNTYTAAVFKSLSEQKENRGKPARADLILIVIVRTLDDQSLK